VNLVRVTVSCTLLVNIAMALLPASQTWDLILIGPAPLSGDLPHQYEETDESLSRNASQVALHARGASTNGITSASSSSSQWPAPAIRITSPEELMNGRETAAQAEANLEEANRLYHVRTTPAHSHSHAPTVATLRLHR